MDFQIRSKLPLSRAQQEYVEERVRNAIGRFAPRIQQATVTLEDLNGPRGGVDIQCRIKLQMRPRGEINVSAVSASLGEALAVAAERAGTRTRTHVQRRRTQSRKPRGADSLSKGVT